MEPGAKKPLKEAKGTEPASRSRLGEFLVEQELITAQVLQEALQEQRQSGRRIGEILLDRGHVTEAQLIPFLTNRLKLPYTDVSTLVLRSDQLNLIPETLARKYTVLPVRLDGKRLDVVMADPMDHEAIQDLSFVTGCRVADSRQPVPDQGRHRTILRQASGGGGPSDGEGRRAGDHTAPHATLPGSQRARRRCRGCPSRPVDESRHAQGDPAWRQRHPHRARRAGGDRK